MKAIVTLGLICIALIFGGKYNISESTFTQKGYEYFLPVKFKDGIFFASKKNEDIFFKLYYSENVEKKKFKRPIEVELPFSSKIAHVAPGEFIEETGEFYFTSNSLDDTSEIKELVIFKSQIENFKLKNVELLKICKPNFSYCHPTFSKDGLKMILSSGEISELNSDERTDFNLYEYVRATIYDDWKLVRNLEEINTSSFDYFPRLMSDSLLIFSSYGKEITKDLNLYSSKLNKEGIWEEATLLEHLNSEFDDFGITFINEESGYFSSDRNGQDNIFYFEKEN